MDETNQQTSEKDLGFTTKDGDGDGTLKDACDSGQGSHLYRKSSGEADIIDKNEVTEPSTISSNGIDSDVKAVDQSTISSDSDVNTEASKLELPKSYEPKSSSKEVIIDEINESTNPEVKDIFDSNESSENVAEKLEEPKCLDLEEDKNEISSSVQDNEMCITESLTVLDDKDENVFPEVNSGNEDISKNLSSLERDNENTGKLENMPYTEKEVSMNDLEIDVCCKNENSYMEHEAKVTESQETSNSRVEMDIDNPCGIEVPNKIINEQSKESAENIDDSNGFITPMEVDGKDGCHEENPLAEQSSETDEEHQTTVNDFSSGYDLKETVERELHPESQSKNDVTLETESMQEENAPFSPNQSDEPESSKDDLQDCQSEKNELLSTEIVNCNDESQIDLNENDKDTEVNNIDTDVSEEAHKHDEGDIEETDIDRSGESESYDRDLDKKEEGNNIKDQYSTDESEAEKQIISVDEGEALIQPGGSEEETITGDTSNEGPIDDSRGKDAEICIIPDDVTPRLSIPPNPERNVRKKCEESARKDMKNLNVSSSEGEKCKEKDEEKSEDETGAKARPTRIAAKLAGNKIKSLVQSDFDPAAATSPKRESEAGSEAAKCDEPAVTCANCGRIKSCKLEVIQGGQNQPLCSLQCYNAYLKTSQPEVVDIEPGTYTRKCAQCHKQVTGDENCLSWETMDFCNEECLGKYQTKLGSNCANCKGSVASVSLGKYCVRFGYDVKQFCTSSCLEEYKKGLKVCSYCQKDISTGTEGFLAPVGDKGHFKDFCTQSCMEKYEQMSNNTPPPNVVAECAVCSNSKPVKVEVELDNKTQKLCSEPCFAAFKFVNNITEGQCDMCKKYFDRLKIGNFSIYYDDSPHTFCCKTCMNVYILANRKIVPCNWCKVKKYNFDMIKKVSVTGQILMMCSLNCLTLYQVSVNAVSARRIMCDFCLTFAQAKYHLTMSDSTVRNFCGYACVMSFQNQYPKQALSLPNTDRLTSPIPTGGPKRILPRRSQVSTPGIPVISSVQSLASPNGPVSGTRVSIPAPEVGLVSQVTSLSQPITIQPTALPTPPPPQVYQQIITKPAPVKQQKNKSVLCKPYSHTKGVSCRPHPCMKETQTDESLNRKFLIPIPVPIYVPAPMHMFATPFPVAMPFPLPVPVPIFIPTTRNSAKGIFKEIKKIQEKIPTDPFEAELLMMAEMVAGEKKQDPTDSESDEGNDGDDGGDGTFSPQNVDTSNTFGEDMLQMALKMATELEEPAVDMESVLTSNTIIPNSQPAVDPNKGLYGADPEDPDQVQVMPMSRGRKRSMRGGRNSSGVSQSKRGRRISGSSVEVPIMARPEPVPPPRIEVEKPDANMCLKYTFGVNAWRHWVMQKNAELEKVALTNRKIKLFKPELLQLTADELNFSLCLFVKEVRKPNGAEYAPDTIYYLCLGIQQYLFENGRIDNIFTDSYYEKFTDCLDEVAKKFAALYNDSQYIVTRVEEEHLWESKQLGAHSPHVLLSTLMFFNTKHFNLVTVEEHMQLSFSHIMKHWKRNPNAPGVAKVPGSRNVLLRFYPPQSALEANSRKKKVYEQQENEENPLRCPVKLYEFYLSKCPESVKTRNDVFYLLPERSCVPDSPVWYSTMALGKEPLTKMLHRVKMVKEINIALLTC